MFRMSKYLKAAVMSAVIALIIALSETICFPLLSVNAAEMQNPDGIYLNQAFAESIPGSRTETLGEWQTFLTDYAATDYYLGTPYAAWLYAASPRGDKWQYAEGFGGYLNSYGGSSDAGGMNCTGFVWHILSNSLAAVNETTMNAVSSGIPNVRNFNTLVFSRKAWSVGNAGWYGFIAGYHLHYYEFDTKAEMLSSGVLRRGDIIWCVDGSVGTRLNGLSIPASYHHIGIYMGGGTDDLWWQSGPTLADGNLSVQKNSINPIYGCAKRNTYVVIPFGEDTEADPVETTASADTETETTALPGSISGDFNGDGALNTADAVMLMRYLTEDDTLTAEQLDRIRQAVPDQNADGSVTIIDLITLLKNAGSFQ